MTASLFSSIRALARDDLIVSTKVNGRELRFIGAPILERRPLRVVWRDLLRVCQLGMFERMRVTRLLTGRFSSQVEHFTIDGRLEATVTIEWAASMMSAAPNMPAGVEVELAAAAEFAVSKVGEAIMTAGPHEGVA